MFMTAPHRQQPQRTSGARAGLSRRTFTGLAGAFSLSLALRPLAAKADASAGGIQTVKGGDATPSLFITIKPDNTIEITCHRSEMGQQTWTAMAQLIAEELDVEWQAITLAQAEGHPRYGDQNTDGSRSVRRNMTRLRTAGAAMRTMLIEAAAQQWGVEASQCAAKKGVVTGPKGKSASYGALADAAAALPLPPLDQVTLKDKKDWDTIGAAKPSLSAPLIVEGKGTFGMDVQLPGMVYAVAARPPQMGGKLKGYYSSDALAVPGVLRTLPLPAATDPVDFNPLGGVAVIAKDTYAAIQGRAALSIDWYKGPNAGYDSASGKSEMMATASKPGDIRRKRGNAPKAIRKAAKKVSADYYVPHLAQAPMEPPVATARWDGDKVECWASVQAPQAARSTVASVCGVPEDNVTIHVTLLGGGFGRKSKPDFVAEAAWLARAIEKPVKMVWTREDDLQQGYLHTVSAQHMEAGLNEDGTCEAILHRTVFPPIEAMFVPGEDNPSWGELRLGASDNPFAVPHLQLETGRAKAHLRTGWLRSVANVYHAFAVQSFAAELAHAAGRDPKDYLLELIGPPRTFDPNDEGAQYDNYGDPLDDYPIDTGRLAHVIETAADMAGWGRSLPEGHGLGIAGHRSFLSYVATAIEVAVDGDGGLTIVGVWSAMDAGQVVNPDHVASQMEGGTIYGLSNALYGAITAQDGAIEQANFPDWRVLRMNEAPRTFETHIVPSGAPPGGVGEPPTPPAAPALANAIFAATGQRYRTLPILGPDRDQLDLGKTA